MTKSWYKNPWVIGIGTTVLASAILDLFKIIPVWKILKTAFSYFVSVPLAALILVLAALLIIVRKSFVKHRSKDQEIKKLQGQLAAKAKKVCINGVFYATDDNGNPNLKEAYCQRCHVNKHSWVMLRIRSDGLFGDCSVCGSFSRLKDEPPPPAEDKDEDYDPLRFGLRP